MDGWYIGTSSLHYRAFNVYIKASRARRVTDTILFKHKYITWPAVTHGDAVCKAASELARVLQGKPIVKSQEQWRDLTKLSEVFSQLAETNKQAADEPTHQRAEPEPVRQRPQTWRRPADLAPEEPARRPPPAEETPRRLIVASQAPAPAAPEPAPSAPARPAVPAEVPSNRAARPRRNVSRPSSYAEPSVAAKLRRGDQFFTPSSQETSATPARPDTVSSSASTPADAPPASRTRARTRQLAASMGAICHAMCASAAMAEAGIAARQTVGRKFPFEALKALNHSAIDKETGELAMFEQVANAVMDRKTGQLLEYRQLLKHPEYKKPWLTSSANEFGRLAQGAGGRIKGTDMIFFVRKHTVPADKFRHTTYAKFVCNERPQKKEVNRTQMTAGGN